MHMPLTMVTIAVLWQGPSLTWSRSEDTKISVPVVVDIVPDLTDGAICHGHFSYPTVAAAPAIVHTDLWQCAQVYLIKVSFCCLLRTCTQYLCLYCIRWSFVLRI